MAKECAGVNRFARRCRPRRIHEISAANARGEGETAREGFAETDEVGNRPRVLAGKPFSCAAEARVNLVENQQRAVLIAKPAQQWEKFRWRDIDASAALDRLD